MNLENGRIVFFYVLKDPLKENAIRYVGYTTDVNKRFSKHIYHAKKNTYPNNHKDNWIRMLLKENSLPLIEVIDEIVNIDDAYKLREIELIKQYRDLGHDLTNMDDGGTGWGLGNQIWKGRKHTEEHKEHMSKILLNRDFSVETRILISEKSKKNDTVYNTNYKSKKKKGCKPINVYDFVTDELLYRFNSILECSKQLNLNRGHISKSIKTEKPYIKYKFKLI